MNIFWERFFFILTYIAQGSSYMIVRAYAIMHWMHHAYTGTESDPHSPKFNSNIFSMMWRTRNIYEGICFQAFMRAFHGAIINWFAHKYGYVNFRMKNTSLHSVFKLFTVRFQKQQKEIPESGDLVKTGGLRKNVFV